MSPDYRCPQCRRASYSCGSWRPSPPLRSTPKAGCWKRHPRVRPIPGGPPTRAGVVEIVARCAPGYERPVLDRCAARRIADLHDLAVSEAGRVVDGVLKEAMVDVERTRIDHADDLALAVQTLVPDAGRARRA